MRSDRPASLTRREREVLELVRVGLTNEEIAGRLGISIDTAKFHVSQILAKLDVSTREEAAAVTADPKRGSRRGFGGVALAGKVTLSAAALAVLATLGLLAWAVAEQAGNDEEISTSLSPSSELIYGLGEDEIVVVDPTTQEVVQTIPTGYNPQIALAPDGKTLYLTDLFTLSVIDTGDWSV